MHDNLGHRGLRLDVRSANKHRTRGEATNKLRRLSGDEIAALVNCAAAGDEHAWDALVRRFDGMIKAIAGAHRLAHADVHDVSQATWLKLLEHIDDLKAPERVGGWLANTSTGS